LHAAGVLFGLTRDAMLTIYEVYEETAWLSPGVPLAIANCTVFSFFSVRHTEHTHETSLAVA
jgi:hypothetical protein